MFIVQVYTCIIFTYLKRKKIQGFTIISTKKTTTWECNKKHGWQMILLQNGYVTSCKIFGWKYMSNQSSSPYSLCAWLSCHLACYHTSTRTQVIHLNSFRTPKSCLITYVCELFWVIQDCINRRWMTIETKSC